MKDTVVSGSLRATDTLYSTTAQFSILRAPTSSGGTTFGPGTSGQVLKSNGTSVYWASDSDSHYTTHMYVNATAGGATSNAATANTTTYLHLYDNTTKRETIQLKGSGTTSITSTGGVITISSADSKTGTVTSVQVQATSPVTSSTNTAQTGTLNTTIALADAYGDTKNPYGSKTKNYVLAAGATANSAPSFRALVAADIPSLSASKITSDTFDVARIPTLSITDKTSGTLTIARGGTGAITATGAITNLLGDSNTSTFYRGDHSWSNIIKQTSNVALGIDTNLKIGTARKDLNFDIDYGTGTGINDGYAGGITFGTGASAYAGLYYQSSGSYGSRLLLATTSSYANGAYARMIITHDGKVGIGKLSPSTLLDVNGTVTATAFSGPLTGNVTGNVTGTSANVTGTVAIANGGTGVTSFTANSLIMSGNTTTAALTTRAIKDMTTFSDLGWTAPATDIYIPTVNTLAHWNGRYNSTTSNLTYCNKGAFGIAATYGVKDTTNFRAIETGTGLITERAVYCGLAIVNNASQSRQISIYAPTSAGTENQILVSAGGTSAPTWKATANGAAYATSANGALTFGTLPVAQGGTGASSAGASTLSNLGLQYSVISITFNSLGYALYTFEGDTLVVGYNVVGDTAEIDMYRGQGYTGYIFTDRAYRHFQDGLYPASTTVRTGGTYLIDIYYMAYV